MVGDFEVRIVERKVKINDKISKRVKVLQYRSIENFANREFYWSDVPIIDEETGETIQQLTEVKEY